MLPRRNVMLSHRAPARPRYAPASWGSAATACLNDTIATATAHGHAHAHAHGDHAHEELGFLRKYVFSLDHKVIGIQYAITGLLFLLFGFTLMMVMRFQLAYPGHPIPVIGGLFGAA